ncbi:hypothetical protein PLESTF_001933600 [Pleodorina starrii]|nr:hypothetical protein PLESTF_001933600 [Pleodorina starrii]
MTDNPFDVTTGNRASTKNGKGGPKVSLTTCMELLSKPVGAIQDACTKNGIMATFKAAESTLSDSFNMLFRNAVTLLPRNAMGRVLLPSKPDPLTAASIELMRVATAATAAVTAAPDAAAVPATAATAVPATAAAAAVTAAPDAAAAPAVDANTPDPANATGETGVAATANTNADTGAAATVTVTTTTVTNTTTTATGAAGAGMATASKEADPVKAATKALKSFTEQATQHRVASKTMTGCTLTNNGDPATSDAILKKIIQKQHLYNIAHGLVPAAAPPPAVTDAHRQSMTHCVSVVLDKVAYQKADGGIYIVDMLTKPVALSNSLSEADKTALGTFPARLSVCKGLHPMLDRGFFEPLSLYLSLGQCEELQQCAELIKDYECRKGKSAVQRIVQ